ncbi:MAG: ribosomal protein S18 acetylase RimI-like enzyme [Myxococcota bacterium]|jgi:ribosomal protein S18 acetylase RimI-like enzyme
MVITELDDITIRQLQSPEDVARWRASFTGAYQTIFSGFPYFERFSPAEAEGVYQKLTSTPKNITLVATKGESQVVGFGVGIPLRHHSGVSRELDGLVPIRHTFYLAELGVLPAYRGRGIGRTLVQERMRRVDRGAFSHVLLRVSTNNTPSSEMYRAMGFEDMGVYMDVAAMRTDGRVISDRRFFMSRVLSQVELDPAHSR